MLSLNLIKCSGTHLRVESESLQLRFSGHVLDVPLIGAPTSFVSEWGEEKRRQPQRMKVSSLLRASFDEGAVVIYFGEPSNGWA